MLKVLSLSHLEPLALFGYWELLDSMMFLTDSDPSSGSSSSYCLFPQFCPPCCWGPEWQLQPFTMACSLKSLELFLHLKNPPGRFSWFQPRASCSELWAEKPEIQALCMCAVIQSWLTLYNALNCSLPASSVPVISQGRILEWVVISSCSGIEPHISCVSCFGRWVVYHWAQHLGSPEALSRV